MHILPFLKRLWPRGEDCPPGASTSPITPEIRFYLVHPDWAERGHPPYRGGYPGQVEGPWLLHEYQQPLVDRILHSIGLPADELARHVEPLLRQFAAIAHLLPASENQHHCAPGGLLRQGLEVAARVLDGCLTTAFDAAEIPARRSLRLRRWYVAGIAAGLLRCLGKPLAEVRASDFEERRHWSPARETLWAWASEHGLNRYFLDWRCAGHAEHAQAALAQVTRLVPPALRAWLEEGGDDLPQAMLDAATAQGNGVLSDLVNRAWAASCRGEAGRATRQAGEVGGLASIPRRVAEAMPRLLQDGTWQVNVPGARVWVADDGVYIAWNQGAGEIVARLLADGAAVIPRSPDTLIGTLADHGIAQRTPAGELYWLVSPHPLRRNGRGPTLRCMKLASPELLFAPGTLPPAIAVSLGKDGGHAGEEKPAPSLPSLAEADGPKAPARLSLSALLDADDGSTPPRPRATTLASISLPKELPEA